MTARSVMPLAALLFLAVWPLLEQRGTGQADPVGSASPNTFQAALRLDSIYSKNADGYRFEQPSDPVIVSWNIERGYDLESIGSYLENTGASIICLQEVDWNNKRTGDEDVLDALAKRLDMAGYFAIEYYELDVPERPDKLKGGGVHGNAILSRIEPIDVYRVELPQFFDWHDPPEGTPKRTLSQKRIGGRFSICGEFRVGNDTVTVCSTHFENEKSGALGRLASLDTLLANITRTDRVVLAGDLNTLDNRLSRMIGMSPKETRLSECEGQSECDCWKGTILKARDIVDPFECKDWTLRKFGFYRAKLDWILVRGLAVSDHGTDGFNTSDHKPLWIRLNLD